MRKALKDLFKKLPSDLKRALLAVRELFFMYISLAREKMSYPHLPRSKKSQNLQKKRVLVYHKNGLGFGGTEKILQTIANALSTHFEVYYMFGESSRSERQNTLAKSVTLIPFTYSQIQANYPHFIKGMVPHFKEVLIEHSIDLIVVADAGFTQYPFNTINNIPIILVNIFGSPTIQKNIKKILFISNTVKHYCEQFTGPSSIHITLPAPVNDPLPQRDTVSFRELYKIPQDAFVFGRIGRASNDILDTISIQAFEQIVSKHPAAYYLIMSPPPALVAIVNERAIPHVIFAPSSAEEKNIWGFHYSIDSLAHFRLDGETLGLNIAESMMVGNPVITHTSHIWNAHIEYLRDRPFARIAHKDDVQQYATFMEEYIQLYSNKTLWNTLRESSHLTALELFSTSRYTKNIITITQEILS